MTTKKRLAAAALATTAAAVFSLAPMSSAQAGSEDKVHCFGVNACKGKNDCKTANNACKGHGSCKGKGFVAMTKETCEKMGGTMDEPKS